MKKKTILGIALTLSLLTVAIVATGATTLAVQQPNQAKFTGAIGNVGLQLPSNSSPPAPPGGVANHPTHLRIYAFDFDRWSTNGAADELLVFIWQPVKNSFQPVLLITDNAANAALWKTVWNNSNIWYPTTLPPQFGGPNLFPNIVLVEPNELEVWTEAASNSGGNGHWGWDEYERYVWQTSGGETLWVNLTKSVKATLPYFNVSGVNSNQTFTLPPMSMFYKGTSDDIDYPPLTIAFRSYPGASQYTLVRTGTAQFAGVHVRIPEWLGAQYPLDVTGNIWWRATDTYTPPP